MTKEWIVDFKLLDLPAAHTWHSVTIMATDPGQANYKAYKELKKRPHVKGKRLTQVDSKVRLAKNYDEE